MTGFWTVGRAAVFMVICFAVSLMLVFTTGALLDRMIPLFIDAGMDAGEGTAWDTTGPMTIMVNVVYMIPTVLSIIGIVVFFLSVTRRNRYEDEEYEYNSISRY
jgi:hypothetical protein